MAMKKDNTNLEKLPSGSYRYRKYINGKTIRITFDHKPDDAEISLALARELNFAESKAIPKKTFEVCCEEYMTMKDNVLSPSTKKGYRSVMRSISRQLMSMDVSDISQITIQNEINIHSQTHSAKTTANVHGFISAVLSMFRPDLTLNTTLPQKVRYESYVPSEAEVKSILAEVEGTKYDIAFQLGVLGLRRSEVCALDLSDLDGNSLSITKAKVKNEHEHWEIKQLTKTENGKRVIFIPDNLVEKIHEAGTIFDGDPTTLLKRLHKAQKELSLPTFRFHDLRAFYASYCHAQGVPDAMIMESGGWKSDYVMKSIYRKALTDEKIRYQQSIANRLL